VTLTGETPSHYRHHYGESGRWLDVEFCPSCGTNLGFTLEAAPCLRTLPAGCFGDPAWIRAEDQKTRHVYLRSRREWRGLSPLVKAAFEIHCTGSAGITTSSCLKLRSSPEWASQF